MNGLRSNPVGILQARDKRLSGYSYKLATGGYGLDVAFTDSLTFDEKAMSIWINFADGNRRDGVGDLLEVGGINLSRHQKNPIVLFDHGKQVTLPIALALEPETKRYTVEIDPISRTARANAFFYQGKGLDITGGQQYEHAVFCEQLYDLMVKGYVRAGSIGYQVVAGRELPPDYEAGTPKGLHLLSVLMLELSAVVLPANGDTVRKVLSLDRVCGKSLSRCLVKSLEPYATESPIMVSKPLGKALGEIRKKYRKKTKKVKAIVAALVESPEAVRAVLNRHSIPARAVQDMGDRIRVVVDRTAYDDAWRELHNAFNSVTADYNSVYVYRPAGNSPKRKTAALGDVRKKYRKMTTVRRRVKRSKPGTTVMFASSKNIPSIRKMAEQKGVKFERVGFNGNLERVRLTGDDAVIDTIAKQYGGG